jgi:hypothetical protein
LDLTEHKEDEYRNVLEPSKADEAALELMKQLITLASGVLALSATFIERLRDVSVYLLMLLAASWLVLLISVFFGLQTISAIVKSRLKPEEYDWSEGYGKTSARISKYGFVAGISLFAIFAFLLLLYPKEEHQTPARVHINANNNGQDRK